MTSDVVVSYLDILPSALASDFESDLRGTGAQVAIERRDTHLQAGLEWLLPTALVVLFARHYVAPLMEEAAKDHYQILKSALTRLVRRTTGRDREVKIKTIGTPISKVESSPPMVLSVYVDIGPRHRAKFCFEHSLDSTSIDRAVEALIQLLSSDPEHGRPIDALQARPPSRGIPIILRFNGVAGEWEIWVPGESEEPS